MFSINNTEGGRGGGGGRMSYLVWEAVLYTNIPCPYSLLRSGQALDEGPLPKREYLYPNFFLTITPKDFPLFQICLHKGSFKEERYSLLFSITIWFQMTTRENSRTKIGQK